MLAAGAGLTLGGSLRRPRASSIRTASKPPERLDAAADADEEKNPLAGDAKAIATGKAIFKDKCKRATAPAAWATARTPIPIDAKTWI